LKVKRVLIPVTVLLVLFAVAPVMAAPATKTPFTAEAHFITGNVDPGETRTTKGNIVQIRNSTSTGTVTGDISGTLLFVQDQTLDMNTGLGVNHGKFVITVVGGTYEGSFRSMFTGLSFTGTFVAQGTGTVEGQILMGSYEGQITIVDTSHHVQMTIDGVILSP